MIGNDLRPRGPRGGPTSHSNRRRPLSVLLSRLRPFSSSRNYFSSSFHWHFHLGKKDSEKLLFLSRPGPFPTSFEPTNSFSRGGHQHSYKCQAAFSNYRRGSWRNSGLVFFYVQTQVFEPHIAIVQSYMWNLDSISFGCIQKTDQQTISINIIGKITLVT